MMTLVYPGHGSKRTECGISVHRVLRVGDGVDAKQCVIGVMHSSAAYTRHTAHTVGRIMCVPHDWRMTIRDSNRGPLSKLKEQLRLAVERQDLVTLLEVHTRMTTRWIWDQSGTMLVCMSQLRRGKILHQEPGHDPGH